MRQGELFALAVDDLDFLRCSVHVAVQIKRVGGRVCFAQTKNRKIRDIPVSARVIPSLAEHVRLYPPAEVTLPWHDLLDPRRHGQMVTRRLMFTKPDGAVLDRMVANRAWQKGLAASWRPRRRPEPSLPSCREAPAPQ
jgi:integrase